MVEGDLRFVGRKILDFADVAFCFGALVLSEINFLSSELLDEWVEGEEVNVLQMVVSSVHLLELSGRLSWVNALEDAQLSEILERKLKFPDRF